MVSALVLSQELLITIRILVMKQKKESACPLGSRFSYYQSIKANAYVRPTCCWNRTRAILIACSISIILINSFFIFPVTGAGKWRTPVRPVPHPLGLPGEDGVSELLGYLVRPLQDGDAGHPGPV